ncbi:MAG TPA: exonuclease domain-containing protein [Flavipsychrobacter sp.]|nr:exonuclease domain-containing protein [Flavipsychrobacter sp.]
MLYAIVDIETTGGNAASGSITEIAIAIHDGEKVLHFYETLVNPNRPIPLFIQKLTGITDGMVANAPAFHEVATQVYELLRDKVFVAHNVNFDYSFVKNQLAHSGLALQVKKLCTVRLSRKVFPGMTSYSLGKLCHQLQIHHANRHRAGGDTMATATLFSMLVKADVQGEMTKMLKGKNREQYLPPHVPVQQVDELPGNPGVYYFYNRTGKVVYVGKAKNIAQRVKTHFSNNKINKQKQDFLREINRISYQECATELMAHILESVEIRKLWPVYNRSQRGYLAKFGLHVYQDREGFLRLTIEKNKTIHKPVYTFNALHEGHRRIQELIREFELCPRLCNLVKNRNCKDLPDNGLCKGHCNETPEQYNEKVTTALQWMETHLPTFAYLDKGNNDQNKSCIFVRKGNVYGMGYVQNVTTADSIEWLQEQLEPLQNNDFIRNLVYKHAAQYPERCIALS